MFLLRLFLIIILSLTPIIAQNEPLYLKDYATEENQHLYVEFIEKNAPKMEAFIALQRLIARFLIERDFESAIAWVEELKAKFEGSNINIDKLLEILKKDEKVLKETNLGELINTQFYEQSPLPSADETKIYYTYVSLNDGVFNDDIYVSEFINGKWQKGVTLGKPINTESAEAPQGLSTDGQTLVLFGNYRGSLGKGDLFISRKLANNQWSRAEHFPPPVNSEFFDCDGKITNDGKAIIFSSDRPNPYTEFHAAGDEFMGSKFGNTDLWVCEKINDTTWGPAINLGKTINTPFAERKPFLHPDGKTLYFSSEGHFGLGKLDMYKSVRLNENSWTEWSEPVNLGKYINGPDDEWGSIITTNGEKAYFAAINKSVNYGNTDIYTIPIPDYAKPEGVAIIKGYVKDELGQPLEATIVWEDLQRNIQLGNIKSDPGDGSYIMVLPLGKNYGFFAKKEGYFPVSKDIDLTKKKGFFSDASQIVLFNLENIEKGNIRLNNLFFDYNKDNLLETSIPELNRLIEILQQFKDLAIEIQGHTDDRGNDKYNLDLSNRRAKSVYNYLVEVGKLDPARLTSIGFGKSKPAVPNNSDANRQLNRRVELKFTRIKK